MSSDKSLAKILVYRLRQKFVRIHVYCRQKRPMEPKPQVWILLIKASCTALHGTATMHSLSMYAVLVFIYFVRFFMSADFRILGRDKENPIIFIHMYYKNAVRRFVPALSVRVFSGTLFSNFCGIHNFDHHPQYSVIAEQSLH